jgi:hypothetical protein
MWKWTQPKDQSRLMATCLLHGGIAAAPTSRPDVSVLAYQDGTIIVAIDKIGQGSMTTPITRTQATDLIELLTEALEVTKEQPE